MTGLTDPAGHTIGWTYDPMLRVKTASDTAVPAKSTTYTYDTSGRVTGVVDRRGIVNQVAYDLLDRPMVRYFNKVGVSQDSTVTYGYDVFDRVQTVTDTTPGSPSAILGYTYDPFDRVNAETVTAAGAPTPRTSIGYVYDAAGRRTSMTLTGQPQTVYSYDNADRLTTITQGTQVVSNVFDNEVYLTLRDGLADCSDRMFGFRAGVRRWS